MSERDRLSFSSILLDYKTASPEGYKSFVDFFNNIDKHYTLSDGQNAPLKEAEDSLLNVRFSISSVESGYHQAKENLDKIQTKDSLDRAFSSTHKMIEMLGGIEEFIEINKKINIIPTDGESAVFFDMLRSVVDNLPQNVFSKEALAGIKDVVKVHDAAVSDKFIKDNYPALDKYLSKYPKKAVSSASSQDGVVSSDVGQEQPLYFSKIPTHAVSSATLQDRVVSSDLGQKQELYAR
jgi:hypothetical protein